MTYQFVMHYPLVFESMPTGVFAILDQNLNIATINKTANEILGTDTDSIMGKERPRYPRKQVSRHPKISSGNHCKQTPN